MERLCFKSSAKATPRLTIGWSRTRTSPDSVTVAGQSSRNSSTALTTGACGACSPECTVRWHRWYRREAAGQVGRGRCVLVDPLGDLLGCMHGLEDSAADAFSLGGMVVRVCTWCYSWCYSSITIVGTPVRRTASFTIPSLDVSAGISGRIQG